MFVRSIWQRDFLSFSESPALWLNKGLTVITGPNGAGKSNLARSLDVARAVLAPHDHPESGRLDLYREAGYEGATEFTVKLEMFLDQPWELDLVRKYVQAAYLKSDPDLPQQASDSLAESLDWLVADSLRPLLSGTLIIRYRAAAARPWAAYWEFSDEHSGATWHAVLVDDQGIDQLRPGEALGHERADGGRRFSDWLMESKPQEATALDFRIAMRTTEKQAVNFSVGSSQTGRVPANVRELALGLGIAPEDRSFSFRQVMNLVLQRGIVLTDNRRLPLQRRFPLSELRGPVDLRDGAAVGGEIFRLKNGDAAGKERFRQVQATFKSLTGRDLDVRARPADDGEAALIIEPTVVGHHSERLVELSGAGMQEALVLSTLLRGTPGRITVLDEPAVNLEPTVQRRLVSQVRGPGQYIVITHSADLVPFDEPDDLKRIVRVAPGTSGSHVRQPDYRNDLGSREQLRQLQLIQPAEIRSLLFAQAAVLCEGKTETGALPRWWSNTSTAGLPDLSAANVSFIAVDGHGSYGAYIKFLDAYGIPWVIISDAPALRDGEKLSLDMKKLGHWPNAPQPDDEDFAKWQSFWERAGVFTLATEFGDDGTKRGEFEEILRQADPELLDRAMIETRGSKPRAGTYFAAAHPQLPDPVADLFRKLAEYLHLTQ